MLSEDHSKKIDEILNIIDETISELKPNFGHIEKYYVAFEILKINEYVLKSPRIILDTLNNILNVEE